jgi:hypothetical protein
MKERKIPRANKEENGYYNQTNRWRQSHIIQDLDRLQTLSISAKKKRIAFNRGAPTQTRSQELPVNAKLHSIL